MTMLMTMADWGCFVDNSVEAIVFVGSLNWENEKSQLDLGLEFRNIVTYVVNSSD